MIAGDIARQVAKQTLAEFDQARPLSDRDYAYWCGRLAGAVCLLLDSIRKEQQ